MLKNLSIIALLSIAINTHAKTREFKDYGSKFTMENPQPMSTVIAKFDAAKSKNILVGGKIDRVCSKKGCWMAMKVNDKEVRITFKDYGFFVPTKLAGNKVWAQGELIQKVISVKEARHFAEDDGASKEDIAKITKPEKKFRFVASAVRVFE